MSDATQLVERMLTERAELAARISQVDAVLSGLRGLYPDLFGTADRQGPVRQPKRSVPSHVEGSERQAPAKFILRDVLSASPGQRWTVERVLAEVTARGWGAEYTHPSGVLRTALRRMADKGEFGVQRERVDGRTWEYWTHGGPSDAESPAVVAGLSDLSDQPPEGGEYTDGQGSHHDHRIDFDGRNGDRDHLGAPVGH